jgi:hypothetical protein
VPDQNHSQAWTYPSRSHRFNFRSHFAANLLRDPGSVKNGC